MRRVNLLDCKLLRFPKDQFPPITVPQLNRPTIPRFHLHHLIIRNLMGCMTWTVSWTLHLSPLAKRAKYVSYSWMDKEVHHFQLVTAVDLEEDVLVQISLKPANIKAL